jgi:hypothetical protein
VPWVQAMRPYLWLRILAVLTILTLAAGCAEATEREEEKQAAGAEVLPVARLKGAYEAAAPLEDPEAIAAIEFDGGGRYLLWRNVGCAEQAILECPEPEGGTYELTADMLTLQDGRSGQKASIPLLFLKATEPASGSGAAGLLAPKQLVGEGQRLADAGLRLNGTSYRLVQQRTLPSFDAMWNAFPHGEADDVKGLIGGRVNADWITNTCTIRLSRALNEAGFLLPRGPANSQPGLHTVTGADGNNYAYRVAEMRDYLVKTVGQPLITQSGSAIDPAAFAGRKGIIAFSVPFSDATGHLDLWDGNQPAHGEYFSKATKVEFWPAP